MALATEHADSPTLPTRWIKNTLDEIGLLHLWNSSIDTKLLCLQRFVRHFGYGLSTLILVAYLSTLGASDTKIGAFMTSTMIGDFLIGSVLTLIADRIGRRRVLALGALLMAGSGVAFALSENYWVLLAAAVLGVITPSGNEIGPFRAIEESTIAHLTTPDERPSLFAWYTVLGTAGGALGLMACGWATTLLIETHAWAPIEAYRLIFAVYAVLGGVKLLLSLLLSKRCEIHERPEETRAAETAPLLAADTPKRSSGRGIQALLPTLSRESRVVLFQLCILFAIDNFASGLVSLAWTANYFQRRFKLSSGEIGSLFFTASIIVAVSIIFSASLARRVGNVRAMVFTHLPSSICLALIGIPGDVRIAIALILLRASTQSMDTAPRSAFVSEVLLPEERTACMGIINNVKTLSQGVGPLVTGVVAGRSLFWLAFLVAGCLKVSYDIGMLLMFADRRPRAEARDDAEADVGPSS